ncbi:chromosome transmission fidelity 4 isoform X2 [Oratosquilla oratoria]|uniref:chromosome transmission fidelity 4 isoform X2 n=1 Tax=Oratosquilla oratoria TaxID=337810 RepID=UPI003F773C69
MAPQKMRPTRYAHPEGFTDICYSTDGKIITCGVDGEVRIWEDLDDDDCTTHQLTECAHAIAYKDGELLVSTDTNVVQSFTMDEGAPAGIITRFTAPATHIIVSSDNKTVVAGASDMKICVHDVTSYKDTILSGHSAPILSVALHPKGDYLASSSCDGDIKVWNLLTESVVKKWSLLPKTNSFSSSNTLCRLTWSRTGKHLLIPVANEIHVYKHENWVLDFTLKDEGVTGIISIVCLSPCGAYIAGGCRDGHIAVWKIPDRKLVLLEKHPKSLAYSGLAWKPGGDEVSFVDVEGQLGTVVKVTDGQQAAQETEARVTAEDLFGGEDDFPPSHMDTMETEDDDEFSISRIKSKLGFADDEKGTFLGLPADSGISQTPEPEPDRTESASVMSEPAAPVMAIPELQKPFQPGMSPEFLDDRYMVWNNVGIVRQNSGDELNSIDVEFFDTAVHHSLHLNNHAGHTMASLSTQALALAAESQDDTPSKLVVHHFAAWDGSQEWTCDMPDEEEICGVCLGNGWVAVGTDKRNLRIYTTAGFQRDMLAIPGPVVCLAGFENLLMVVFHNGLGVMGDQNLGYIVLNVFGKKHPVPLSAPIPLSPKSFLAWAGFSDEGTPVIMDSAGLIKMMYFKYGYNWTTILNSKSMTRGKSDHYFVLGASESQGKIRCVLCKGSRYPPVLPRPHVMQLDIKLPLCDMGQEKGTLEEKILRTDLLMGTLSRLGQDDYDVEESRSEAKMSLNETMIKLFALACRSDRETRAQEICQHMPTYQAVRLAIKYAGKLRKMQLANRLGDVAAAKMHEEWEKQAKEKEEEDDLQTYGAGIAPLRRKEQEDEEEDEEDIVHTPNSQQEDRMGANPLVVATIAKANSSTSKSDASGRTRNPFKKPSGTISTSSESCSSSRKGIDILDDIPKAQPKKTQFGAGLRPALKKPQIKQSGQRKALVTDTGKGKENQDTNVQENQKTFPKPAKKASALQLWFEDNKDAVKAKYPELEDSQLLPKAALIFKDEDDAVKQKYKTLALESVNAGDTRKAEESCAVNGDIKNGQELSNSREEEANEVNEKKRKNDSPQESPAKKKGSGIAKLSAFAFSKES